MDTREIQDIPPRRRMTDVNLLDIRGTIQVGIWKAPNVIGKKYKSSSMARIDRKFKTPNGFGELI
ncbi:hypothetical protein OnM2_024066 [Erysiphe neolycopersici]|uniref:Uncharacterized protein n=1 Tax=Erysiphe neolycopersici TaxID=212602 RepID=A0A420I1Y0_9PEZI|nr:hypothetical protein OnM2_024066 [Erysiphe neolycopersici]